MIVEKAPSGTLPRGILTPVSYLSLGRIRPKPTRECFSERLRYYHRDPDIDSILPPLQREIWGRRHLTVFKLPQMSRATFPAMARQLLGFDVPRERLAQVIIEHRHTVSVTEVEAILEREHAHKDTGLNMRNCATFFFIENDLGSISVLLADQNENCSNGIRLLPFEDDASLWHAEHTLVGLCGDLVE